MTRGSADEADSVDEAEKKGIGVWFAERRRKWPWLDHVVLAGSRFSERNGDHLAAAITYFSFLALFPLLLLAVSVAGFVLASRPDLTEDLTGVIRENIPGGVGETLLSGVDSAIDSRASVGVISLIVLLYSGLGWISNLRIAVQAMWGHEPPKSSFLRDKVGDLIALATLGAAMIASVALTAVAGAMTDFVVSLLGLDDIPGASLLTGLLAIVIAILGDMVIFLWVIVNLPRRRVPYRAVLRGALLGAVGFEILKYVGTIYIAQVTKSPAAGVFGSVIGLLVWINLASRFLLFVTTWTATSRSVLALEEPVVEEVAVVEPPPPAVSQVPPVAVLGTLVGVGAVIGLLLPGFVRRWWNGSSRPEA